MTGRKGKLHCHWLFLRRHTCFICRQNGFINAVAVLYQFPEWNSIKYTLIK